MADATHADSAHIKPVAPAAEDSPVPLAAAVSSADAFRRFWPWARPDRYRLAASVVLLIAGSAGEVASVWLFKNLVDQVLIPHRFTAFLPLAGLMAAVAVVAALLTFAGEYLATWVAERFLLRLRTSVVEHLHSLPPDILRTRRHGDVVARLTSNISQIEELVASGLIASGSAVISLLFFVAAAFYLSWPLALAALAAAPFFWLAARLFSARIHTLSREAQRCEGSLTAVVEESLTCSALAHAYNRQAHEVERVRREGEALLRAELSTARVAHLYPSLLNVFEVVGALAVVGLGAFELTRNALTLGGLLAFAAFLAQLFGPVQELSGLASVFGSASAGAERVIELLDMRSPVRERPDAPALAHVQGRVECLSVAAVYPSNRRGPVLRDVSFSVAPGEVLAIMGPSGAGKSTLAKLLVRFMDPDSGSVRLDGVDLRDVTTASVRAAVTLLPQHAQLFHTTIRDNIAYGWPRATMAEIIQAAKDADAHEFITALPDGYLTTIGENGFQLSGGQSRRIAIARAFLRATPVLILDEPTAGLDHQAAAHVLAPLRRLMAGRTTILITHDQALAQHADAIHTLHGPGAEVIPQSEGYSATKWPAL
ncbi:ABC transporter ATP-binding protein [Streptomyces sp. NPDC002758]